MFGGTVQCDFWDFVGFRKGVQELKTKYVEPAVKEVQESVQQAKEKADEIVEKIKKGIASAQEMQAEYNKLMKEYQSFIKYSSNTKKILESYIKFHPKVKKDIVKWKKKLVSGSAKERAQAAEKLKQLVKSDKNLEVAIPRMIKFMEAKRLGFQKKFEMFKKPVPAELFHPTKK